MNNEEINLAPPLGRRFKICYLTFLMYLVGDS
jgi:hypothetical protein